MVHTVYILKSLRTGRRYIGVTQDLQRRLADHNRGKNKSVRGRGPYEVIWTEECATRDEAVQREKQLKRQKGGEGLGRLLAANARGE
ncbi:MAG TPA: GIY-YIG nuclease family protein [bacterium]